MKTLHPIIGDMLEAENHDERYLHGSFHGLPPGHARACELLVMVGYVEAYLDLGYIPID
jgi:hypothetical protein